MRPKRYIGSNRAAIVEVQRPAANESARIPYSPISEALASFFEGNNHRAAALFHNVDLPGCAAMRARVWLRLLRYDRVIAEYARRDLSSYEPQEAVQLALTSSHAFALQGDAERAFAMVQRARDIAVRCNDRFLVALCSEHECAVSFMLGDLALSRRLLEVSEKLLSTLGGSKVFKIWHFDLAGLKARLLCLRGWHNALESNFLGQAEAFLECAIVAGEPNSLDRAFEGRLLANLALIVERQPFEAGIDLLRQRYESFPWTGSTDEIRSLLGQAIQNYDRLFGCGDAYAKPGGGSAPTLALRLSSAVAMLFHGRWQTKRVFLEELRFCVSVALEIDWSEVMHCFPTLLGVAGLVAPFDLDLARKVKATYDRYRPFASRHLFGALEPTARANELFCDACISKAEGKFPVAIEQFGRVSEILSGDDCFPTAAIAGIERYTMTKMPADLVAPRTFVASFPKSSFSLRLRDALAGIEDAGFGDFPYLGIYGTIQDRRSHVEV